MTEIEFKKNIKRVTSKRLHKVRNSIGVYDIYKHIRKNKWYNIPRPLKEGEFYKIIRSVNQYLGKALSEGREIKLPHRLGKIELRKAPVRMSIVNNKLVTNLPIDWDATLKLWYKDEEAYNNRMLVRCEPKEVFKIFYNKYGAEYTNMSLFEFKPNRELSKQVSNNIKDGILDAYLDRYD